MEYREFPAVSARQLADLRESVGWNRMEAAYQNPAMRSFCSIGAFAGEELVGYIDCVSNGVTDAYIQDLMVHPQWQGRGIGTELMQRMIGRLKASRIYMISVLYDAPLALFYRRFGFTQILAGQMENDEGE